MADCRHIANSEIAISQRESSAFDEIWYTNADLELDDSHNHVPKCEFFKNYFGNATAIPTFHRTFVVFLMQFAAFVSSPIHLL